MLWISHGVPTLSHIAHTHPLNLAVDPLLNLAAGFQQKFADVGALDDEVPVFLQGPMRVFSRRKDASRLRQLGTGSLVYRRASFSSSQLWSSAIVFPV